MATTNTTSTSTPPQVESSSVSGDELTAKAVHKRYEGLVMVRNKAIKGKGAWYWAHLERMLVQNTDSGLPKAVKLRCSLCEAVFSASNPSRTASEHLKRGTCPNFNSLAKPISSISSPSTSLASPTTTTTTHNHRKRSSSSSHIQPSSNTSSYQVTPLAVVDPSRFCGELAYSSPVSMATTVVTTASTAVGLLPHHHQQHHQQQHHQHLMLSGGKEDLGALAMLVDSVKNRII